MLGIIWHLNFVYSNKFYLICRVWKAASAEAAPVDLLVDLLWTLHVKQNVTHTKKVLEFHPGFPYYRWKIYMCRSLLISRKDLEFYFELGTLCSGLYSHRRSPVLSTDNQCWFMQCWVNFNFESRTSYNLHVFVFVILKIVINEFHSGFVLVLKLKFQRSQQSKGIY